MKQTEWESEVKRVADILGMDSETHLEFLMWTVEMAFDNKEKAEKRFTGERWNK